MKPFILILALGWIWLGKLAPARAEADSPRTDVVVIVHPRNSLNTLDRKTLTAIFLKKKTQWPDGQFILPVDRGPRTPVRYSFSETLLDKTVFEVKSYWQRMIFSGREVPPPELDTEDEIISYVLRNPGAIGYVSTSARTDGSKILEVR